MEDNWGHLEKIWQYYPLYVWLDRILLGWHVDYIGFCIIYACNYILGLHYQNKKVWTITWLYVTMFEILDPFKLPQWLYIDLREHFPLVLPYRCSKSHTKFKIVEFTSCEDQDTTTSYHLTKTQKYQPLVDILENPGMYVTLTILTIGTWSSIHMDNITKLLEQWWYIPLIPIHTCMQQIYLIAIKYLTLVMLKKRKLKTTNNR